MKKLILKTVNKEIQKEYPFLELVKGEGYFYFISIGDEESTKALSSLNTTTVLTYKLNDFSMKQWLSEAKDIYEQMDYKYVSEYYNFLGACFDVAKAKHLFADKEVFTMKTQPWSSMVVEEKRDDEGGIRSMGMVHVDVEHAKKSDTSEPVMIAQCVYDNGEMFNMLIDGNHRMYKCLYLEKQDEINVVVLEPHETEKIIEGPMKNWLTKYLKSA